MARKKTFFLVIYKHNGIKGGISRKMLDEEVKELDRLKN